MLKRSEVIRTDEGKRERRQAPTTDRGAKGARCKKRETRIEEVEEARADGGKMGRGAAKVALPSGLWLARCPVDARFWVASWTAGTWQDLQHYRGGTSSICTAAGGAGRWRVLRTWSKFLDASIPFRTFSPRSAAAGRTMWRAPAIPCRKRQSVPMEPPESDSWRG